ncbi:AAA family ATPase [Capnocytophaga canimorsus]|uniref:AAA family ATPase n=1 Tax=Capnocytophaga canimorsus TaxID=28188 RepID=UPI001EDE0A5F|nr:ATP-binding protein [Capnocytophaga canimorsus]GJQ05417.1 DNA recombination protein RecF [Capnocytophaga canimorsus]
MKLHKLYLKNIGPFLEGEIEFDQVTILTGENGTGKTVVLDAIRKMLLSGNFKNYDIDKIRHIRRSDNFYIEMSLTCNKIKHILKAKDIKIDETSEIFNVEEPFFYDSTISSEIPNLFQFKERAKGNLWIANYWTSQNDHSDFHISSLDFIKPENYLINSLDGIQKNAETTKIVTFFDYYKSSDKPEEKKEGEYIFEVLKKIFKISLYEGEFVYVDRSRLIPVIIQNGYEVSLDKLSSGNLYLVQRLIGLLGQMYSVYKLNNLPLEEMCNTSGLLLIDEAENHLHPKWQKTFIKSILELFPNLQIVAATHSPFIVGSVENAKIYVCKPETDHSIIVDETANYSNKPIEEILISEVFGGTTPFANEEINKLLKERKEAIEKGDKQEEERTEKRLLELNPQYFSYLEMDKLLDELKNK